MIAWGLARRATWVGVVLLGAAAAAENPGPTLIARWSFDEGKGAVAGDAAGSSTGRIEKAAWAKGKESGALAFDDYSLKNYLKPDVREAARVVVPHQEKLDPTGPFTIRAVVYPTRDPLYFGGIVEKGKGYGGCYRLGIVRGAKVRGAVGPAHGSVTSAEPIKLEAWHDLQLEYDGETLTLTVDGKEQGTAKNVKGALTCRDDLVIGERFSGRIDEISISSP